MAFVMGRCDDGGDAAVHVAHDVQGPLKEPGRARRCGSGVHAGAAPCAQLDDRDGRLVSGKCACDQADHLVGRGWLLRTSFEAPVQSDGGERHPSTSCEATNKGAVLRRAGFGVTQDNSMHLKCKAPQRAAGAALRPKRGDTPKNKLKGPARNTAKSMSEKELKKMASIKRTPALP